MCRMLSTAGEIRRNPNFFFFFFFFFFGGDLFACRGDHGDQSPDIFEANRLWRPPEPYSSCSGEG